MTYNVRKYVDIYEADKNAFYKDFAEAFEKLLELGIKAPGKVAAVCPMRGANL